MRGRFLKNKLKNGYRVAAPSNLNMLIVISRIVL